MGLCDWCNREVDDLVEYESFGIHYNICKKCKQAVDDDVCITCGESLYGEPAVNGECSGCQQIRAAEAERRKSEILNGLGLEALQELTHSVVFTEEDYKRWVTFSQCNLSPELRRKCRRAWVKTKLMLEFNWSEEIFEANAKDVEYLLDNYAHRIFNKNCILIVLDGQNKGLRGVNIIARSGNVVAVEG